MAQDYEVEFTKRLDGEDQYGNVTDSVRFVGESDSALWRHAPSTDVSNGTKVYGTISDEVSQGGKAYRKFKKEQREDGTPQTSGKPAFTGGRKPDNSDGMRQGMCINNGAQYVANNYAELTPEAYAKKVEAYARELYKIDLTKEEDLNDILKDL